MATQTNEASIRPTVESEFASEAYHLASSTDDVVATYTFTAPAKLAGFAYYQPAGGTTVAKKYIGGDSNKSVQLLSDNANTSGESLAGKAFAPGDQLVITHDTTNGTKGHQILVEPARP